MSNERIGADQLVYLVSAMMQAKREAELKAEAEAQKPLAKVIPLRRKQA